MTNEDKTLWQWGGPVEDDADGLYVLLPIIEKLSTQQLHGVYCFTANLLIERRNASSSKQKTAPRTASQIALDFGDNDTQKRRNATASP